ncbi:hypothetical protein K443DRAFT_368679 [Laccaria amethystina LaAM-08-1]|uniref:Unplaced genomic scaffold K443scaffold_271, whole genome shotgun sequence n=1 Tax=Laccaria amethystina LaAM-08-1 TaxID=1095629 RepID=A0A0C9WRQ8_9AGAR|nr:hypothetical protein K443DRAFT_368679 [Laccaria amethystina LaAM-08-1]
MNANPTSDRSCSLVQADFIHWEGFGLTLRGRFQVSDRCICFLASVCPTIPR